MTQKNLPLGIRNEHGKPSVTFGIIWCQERLAGLGYQAPAQTLVNTEPV